MLWLYNAIYVVDEQEQAVILRFGKYYETVGPGLNFYFPPIDKRFQENVTRERAYSKQGQMLTEDENIVEVPLTVQYKISNLQDFVLNVDQPEVSLQQATESALRHVAGSTTMDRILTEGREQMATEVRERLQRFLDTYRTGITVTQVNIQSAQAPREVQEAFDDVIRAREDEQREKNQAEAYANGVVPEARGQAQRIIEEANGYRDEVISRAQGEADRFSKLLVEYRKAPEVTRERLYLDTMQEVFSQTSKVLVTGQQGQNNLLYLPLDKMIDGRNAAPATGPVLPPVVAAPALPTWGRGSSTICGSKTRVRGRAADGQQVFDRSDRRCRRRHRPVEQRLRSPADRARGHVALRPGGRVRRQAGPALQDPVRQPGAQVRRSPADPGCPDPALPDPGKKAVMVDAYAKWRVADAERFYTATSGLKQIADERLSRRLEAGLRDQFGKRTLHEVVSGERDALMGDITASLNRMAQKELGIEVIDVRVKAIDLPKEVNRSVFERMSTEREREAREHRAKGRELAEGIRADADRQRRVIVAEAYRESEETRGDGDSKAAAIYAKAYNQDPEFYSFYRSLKAYRESFAEKRDVLVLDPSSEFFRYLNKANK